MRRHAMRAPAVLIPAMLALASPPAVAFEPKLHERYSLRAGEMVRQCSAFSQDVPTWDEILSFARGTVIEDAPSFERLANWHYARNGRMGRYFIFPLIRMDLDRIFDRRIRELFEYAAGPGCMREGLFERAGRLTHYIQDMRVPAHILPINHGAGFGSDAFDEYPFRDPKMPPTAEQCEAWTSEAERMSRSAFASRLAKARDHTRDAIECWAADADGHATGCTWRQLFWCDPTQEACDAEFPGFGTYRSSNRFGDVRLECRGRQVRFDEAVYDNFFRDGHQMMMADTAVALLIAKALAERHNCAPESK